MGSNDHMLTCEKEVVRSGYRTLCGESGARPVTTQWPPTNNSPQPKWYCTRHFPKTERS